MNIGLKIKNLVTEKKMSVIELSEKLGKSRQTTYDLLDKPHVSSEILVKLSELFKLPITYFFDENNDGNFFPAVIVGKEQASSPVEVGKEQVVSTAIDVGEVMKLKKALYRERKARELERKARELERNKYLSIIEQQAKR